MEGFSWGDITDLGTTGLLVFLLVRIGPLIIQLTNSLQSLVDALQANQKHCEGHASAMKEALNDQVGWLRYVLGRINGTANLPPKSAEEARGAE